MGRGSTIGACRAVNTTSLSMNKKAECAGQLPNIPPMKRAVNRSEKEVARVTSKSGPVMKKD